MTRILAIFCLAIAIGGGDCKNAPTPPGPTPPPSNKAACKDYSATDCLAATPTSGKKCAVGSNGSCRDDQLATCADYSISECAAAKPTDGKKCVAGANGACREGPLATCADYAVAACEKATPTDGMSCFVGSSGLCGARQADPITKAFLPLLNDPITKTRFVDPVTARDGYTYSRASIESWFAEGKNTSPVTGAPLTNHELKQNFYVKNQLELLSLESSLFGLYVDPNDPLKDKKDAAGDLKLKLYDPAKSASSYVTPTTGFEEMFDDSISLERLDDPYFCFVDGWVYSLVTAQTEPNVQGSDTTYPDDFVKDQLLTKEIECLNNMPNDKPAPVCPNL